MYHLILSRIDIDWISVTGHSVIYSLQEICQRHILHSRLNICVTSFASSSVYLPQPNALTRQVKIQPTMLQVLVDIAHIMISLRWSFLLQPVLEFIKPIEVALFAVTFWDNLSYIFFLVTADPCYQLLPVRPLLFLLRYSEKLSIHVHILIIQIAECRQGARPAEMGAGQSLFP